MRRSSVTRRSRLAGALALGGMLLVVGGCEEPEDADVEFIYEMADYDMAENAVTGQVRSRLERQQIELRGLWLGLRPVEDGPSTLNADVDVYAEADQAEEIARLVAEVSLNALPRHELVQVRVFWWRDTSGEDYAHNAGTWVWNAGGELIRHIRPE
ncbi:MAG: hypothetical protein ACOX9R_02590 [Armatimonadota bacterium]|jgi:hypothetical protein